MTKREDDRETVLKVSENNAHGYILVTFNQDDVMMNENVYVEVNTNVSKLVAKAVFNKLLEAVSQEDDGGTSEH
jgi:adenylate cyclase